MTTNDMTPQQPRDHEPLGELFREVFDLVDETVENITDDEVDERLSRLLTGARRHHRGRWSALRIFVSYRTDDQPLPGWETKLVAPVDADKTELSTLRTPRLVSLQPAWALQAAQHDAAVAWAQANSARRDAHTYARRAAEARRAANAADEIAAAAAKRAARITAEAHAQVNAALDRVSAAASEADRTAGSILAAAEQDAARRAREIVAAAEQRAAELVLAAQQHAMWTIGDACLNAAQVAAALGGHQPSSTTAGSTSTPKKTPALHPSKPSWGEVDWSQAGIAYWHTPEPPRRIVGITLVPERASFIPARAGHYADRRTPPWRRVPADDLDTVEGMLSMLLDSAVETLDISPELQQLAVERYEKAGSWLADHGGDRWRVYPQGSFRLGTVLRPAIRNGEFDIDLVCWYGIAKQHTTQEKLKQTVGGMLHRYLEWKKNQPEDDGPDTCESRRRCWTLTYPSFHLDVLPTIPDEEYPPTGILFTDKRLRQWQHSNPIGYANWFRTRSVELQRGLVAAAKERLIHVDDVPEFTVRTTLQRVVQVLKWDAMIYFASDADNMPPSILITTLAGHVYDGEPDLHAATVGVLERIPRFIENRNGTWWVANPAHEKENFTNKWNEYPQRRTTFYAWLREVSIVLQDAAQLHGNGLDAVATRLSESFDTDPIKHSAQRYSDYLHRHREAGRLRMTSAGLLTTAAGRGPKAGSGQAAVG
jgi:hypothetical protein